MKLDLGISSHTARAGMSAFDNHFRPEHPVTQHLHREITETDRIDAWTIKACWSGWGLLVIVLLLIALRSC